MIPSSTHSQASDNSDPSAGPDLSTVVDDQRPVPAPDRQDPVWDRLSEAFSRAAIEARVPFVMCLEDRWGQW